jgi:hypothetical protein
MDPITATGLAASVIQFVQFGSKLISQSIEIYQSTDGALGENIALADIAKNLSELNSVMQERQPRALRNLREATAAKRNAEHNAALRERQPPALRQFREATAAKQPNLGVAKSTKSKNLSVAEKQLDQICEECDRVTRQLLKGLDKLKLQGRHRKWGSFRQALSNVWSQGEIRALEKKLNGVRKRVDTTLLVYLRYVW